jgi:hypothetical protein
VNQYNYRDDGGATRFFLVTLPNGKATATNPIIFAADNPFYFNTSQYVDAPIYREGGVALSSIYDKILTFSGPLSRSANTISIPQASSSVNGYLSSSDWSLFNGKVSSQWANVSGGINYSGGNVGIGVATPLAQIHLSNAVQNRKIVLFGGVNDHQYYGFGINPFTLRYQVETTSADHVFFAATSDSASNELMRIRGNGNVGIGTASPRAPLQIGTGDGDKIVFSESGGIAGSKIAHLNGFGMGHYTGRSGSNDGGFFSFNTSVTGGYTERMRITPTGVGINGDPGSQALRVNGDVTFQSNVFRLEPTTSNNGMFRLAGVAGECFFQVGPGTAGGATKLRFTSLFTDTTTMTIDTSTTNVGIGTTTPASALTISRSGTNSTVANNSFIVLSNRNTQNATTVVGGIMMDTYRDNANPHYSAGIWFNRNPFASNASSESDILFGAANNVATSAFPTERMRILGNNGHVGIGLTAPTSRLHVVNDTAGADNLAVFSNANTGTGTRADLSVRANNAHVILSSCSSGFTGNASFGGANGSSLFTNGAASGGLSIASRASAGVIRFYTGGDNERMRILSTGQVCVNTTTSVANTQCTINGVASCQFLRQTAPLASFWDISASQSIANASTATVTWNRTRYGTSLLTWNVSINAFVNNQTYSILVDFKATIGWAGSASGFRVCYFDHSVYGRLSFSDIVHNGTEFVGQTIQTQILMPAGASISVKVYQTRGGALNLLNDGVIQTQLFFSEIPLSG